MLIYGFGAFRVVRILWLEGFVVSGFGVFRF